MNNNDTNHADCEGCNPPMGVQDVKGVNIPEWVKSQPDESAVKWDDKGFFYLTDEDHKNGKSNDHHALPEPFSKRTDYDFGPFGKLRAVLIEGLAWCSLEDAGQVAGVPTSWITGYLPEDQDHVRGVPGQLEPEGIRDLRPQGIRDSGIRLDALVKHVEEHRGDDPRVSKMLASAIADIYDKDLPGEVSMDTRRIVLWRPHASPKKPGQIYQQALYCPLAGEYHVVRLGTQLWFQLGEISEWTGLPPEIICRMAGDARMLTIPNALVYPMFDNGGQKTYLRADFVEKLHAAMPDAAYYAAPFVIEIVSKHRENLGAAKYDPPVMAAALHGMLGPHLDFGLWSEKMRTKNVKLLRDRNFNWPHDKGDNFPIPLTLARDIAAKEGTFAGEITAILLTDGGYLHRGKIVESPNATLKRFKDLIPDRHGRVQLRKIWEFLNLPDSFQDWYEASVGSIAEPRPAPGEATASVNSHWCQLLWEYTKSDHYHPILK